MTTVRSQPALEALQWTGLLAGPLAFAAEHVVGVETSLARCNPAGHGWAFDPRSYQLAAMIVAACVIVAAEAAALLAFRATGGVDDEADPPAGRIHFLAAAALVIGPIFLTLVLLNGLGAFFQPECRSA